jgi:formate hydrogenlyase subunit 4
MIALLALVVHVALMLGAAFLLAAVAPWAGALLERRAGPPLLQPWHDWRRLLRKRPVRPDSASPLHATAPLACLASLVVAVLLVPSFSLGMATGAAADLILIAGLLTAGRVLLALAMLESGSAPGSVAAAVSLRTGLMAEPALLVVGLVLALLTGSTNLPLALAALRDLPAASTPVLLVLAGLAGLVFAAETEGIAGLDAFSGWYLAAGEAAFALRRVIWLSLLAALLFPASLALPGFDAGSWLLAIFAWAAKILGLGAACSLGGSALSAVLPRPGMTLLGGSLLLLVLGLLFLLAGGEFA